MKTLKELLSRAIVKGTRPILGAVDELLLRKLAAEYLPPPVFIIGPPRSGTTLLYQLLVQRYRLAYFSNLTAGFYKTPITVFWIETRLLGNVSFSSYSSHYGKTMGWRGPHECGSFWYRWFPRGEHVYVAPGATPKSHLDELHKTVAAMSLIAQAPMVFKNVYNSMRIAPVIEAFPEACFLVCWRDPVDASQSILNGRKALYGDVETWMGVPPREYDDIKRHPYWEQVVEQVYYVYQQIEQDRQRFGAHHFYEVSYEDLCKDTSNVLVVIKAYLETRGVPVDVRNEVEGPLPYSTGQQVGDLDYQRIVRKVEELWS